MAIPSKDKNKIKYITIEIGGIEYKFTMEELVNLKFILQDLGIVEKTFVVPYCPPVYPNVEPYIWKTVEYPTVTWEYVPSGTIYNE